MQEEFRIIKDFENYSVSNFGYVKKNKNGRILKLRHINDYSMVNLSMNGKSYYKRVRLLVAEAFILNPNQYIHVDNINNDRGNNNISNLRWITYKKLN